MFKELKKNTVPLKNAAKPEAEGRVPVGEFCDIEKTDWIGRYQQIIDRFETDGGSDE